MVDFFLKLNNKIPSKGHFLTKIKVSGLLRRIIKHVSFVALSLFFQFKPKKVSLISGEKDIIVSLTSFPMRINGVWLTIETILNQTVLPGRIILWLSRDQFKSKDDLPKKLRGLESRGVEIYLVENDYRSHKKYLYLKDLVDSYNIITIDDDILYPKNLINNLVRHSKQNQNFVICNYAYQMCYNNSKLESYNKWKFLRYNQTLKGNSVFFGSGGGTYFPIGSLTEEAFDVGVIMAICKNADDVWLNAIIRLNGFSVMKIESYALLNIPFKNNFTLFESNITQNDSQIKNIQEYFIQKKGVNLYAQEFNFDQV